MSPHPLLAACLCSLLLVLDAPAAHAQTPSASDDDAAAPARKALQALRVEATQPTPTIDGHLDEAVWAEAHWVSDFRQREPVEGGMPSQQTEVAVLYDAQALYIGARMAADDPATIRALVTRRDQETSAEQLAVSLDTYHNRRTAYTFAVTAGGVRIEYYHDEDDQDATDYTFDPVWSADVQVGATGWTAEMRIPFSQLRFNAADPQVWGLNINRKMPAQNEDVYWVYVPKEATGWASRFGTLEGLRGIRPARRLELLPYVASNADLRAEVNPLDPFAEKTAGHVRVGGDVKMGLGPNLTLDATINPDFGQVDADPAEVNLSAFETFFQERRPFFTEGSDLLRGGHFYSRRIGTAPRGFFEGDFVDRPDNTTILGAAKLSGRLPSGFSLAALGALTDVEYARTYTLQTEAFGRTKVEPLTRFLALAGQQEFGANQSTLGFLGTAVSRSQDPTDPIAMVLNDEAVTGQVSWDLRFKGGTYNIEGSAGGTHVRGTAARIAALQRSPVHYFQRPDAGYVTFDPTRTRLSGWAADVWLGKNSGAWTGGTFLNIESPSYNTNDLGRLGRADEVAWFTTVEYRETEPGPLFHRYSVELSSYNSWNHGGERVQNGADLSFNTTWINFWRTTVFAGFNPRTYSDTFTRGGPRMAVAGERNVGFVVGSNTARRFWGNVYVFYEVDGQDRRDFQIRPRLSWQPGTRLDLRLSPAYSRTTHARQYVTTRPGGPPATFGARYVISNIDRSVVSAQIRINYTFTPDFTLELYAEPFAASGRFYNLGELTEASGIALRRYGTDGTTLTHSNRGYTVTDGTDTFTLPNRDFNVLSFRSNLVLRWEWRPGSTLFLVWQQRRDDFAPVGDFVQPGDLFDTLQASGNHFFSLKLSYWIPAG